MDLPVTWNKLVAYSVTSYLESAGGSRLVLYMYVENILYQYVKLIFCHKSNFSGYWHIEDGGIGITSPHWALLGYIDDLAGCVRRKYTDLCSYLLPGLRKFKKFNMPVL